MRNRTSPPWFPLWVDKWLFGSTRIELKPDERSVWIDLMALAQKDEGYIRANETVPYGNEQLAGMLCISQELLIRTIGRCTETQKIEATEHGTLKVTNYEKYQLTGRRIRQIQSGNDKISDSGEHVTEKEEAKIKSNININIKSKIKNKDNGFLFDFENIWKQYPNKDGKKDAERHFRASIKNDKDYQDIQTALKNYLNSKRVQAGYIKNGSTWFNNWRDWVTNHEANIEEIKNQEFVKKLKQINEEENAK